MADPRVLVINPGSTSTRLALFEGERQTADENIPSAPVEGALIDALPSRLADVTAFLERHGSPPLHAVVGRGGLLAPVASGTIRVDETMLDDARRGARGEHPSNLGCLLADAIARRHEVSAFIVDPVSVDELAPEARLTGIPEIARESLAHALNLHAAARWACGERGVAYALSGLVVAHLGGGFSIAAMRGGHIVDVCNANSGGPLSPTRAGMLPTQALIKMCFSGRFSLADMKRLTTRDGGLRAHLGTDDAREVERRIAGGDKKAQAVYDAMAYQTGKEIGAMAAALDGRVDAIVLTGGLAHSNLFCEAVTRRVSWIAPVLRRAGEFEMQALAAGALRVLRGEEPARCYREGVTV